MERLLFNDQSQPYSPSEAAIHIARYQIAKQWVEGKRVLDIACGEGYGSWMLKQWGARSITAIDISPEAIFNAQKNFSADGIEFVCGNAQALSLDANFELIISLETIEHIANPHAYLLELKRLLAPNGMIIISCPNDHWYWPSSESNPYHHKKYTLQDFSQECEAVLGQASYWLLGGNVFGYGSYLYNPKLDTIAWHQSSLSPRDITSLAHPSMSMCHNLVDKLPNAAQSLYYVGIWGAQSAPMPSGAVFPTQPIKTDIQNLDPTLATLRQYIHELEEGTSTLNHNEATLRAYIYSLEHAVSILKKDNENSRLLDQLILKTSPHSKKRTIMQTQIHHHNYFLLKEHCKNKTILDIGCGDGEGCALLAEFGASRVVGVDLNVSFVEQAKECYPNKTIHFLVGNAEQIDQLFDNETFDIILIHQTIEYMVDKEKCLAGAKKLLSPDGACVISCNHLKKTHDELTALAPYSSEQFIHDVRLVFGDSLRILKSYPLYGVTHCEVNESNYQMTTPEPLDDQTSLACTIIYDSSQRIKPSAYLNVINTSAWQALIAHDDVTEIKKDRLIFELQQRTMLAQGLIIENQLLQEKLNSMTFKKSIASFSKQLIRKLKRNKIAETTS